MLEEETGEQLSLRGYETVLKERGYSIGKTLIGWFDFAVDVLYPAISTALQAGMGRPQIERIKALDRAFGQCWQSLELGPDGMSQDVFIEVLSRHDAEQLDLDAIRRDLETELSVTADVDLQRASLQFGAALDGRHQSDSSPVTVSEQHVHGETDETDNVPQPPTTSIKPRQPDVQGGSDHSNQTPQTDGDSERSSGQVRAPTTETTGKVRHTEAGSSHATSNSPEEASTQLKPAIGRYKDATNPAIFEDPISPKPTPDELPLLRERAWALARGIAVMARLGPEVIHQIPTGVGFLIGPAPYEIIAQAEQQLGPQHINHLRHLWWVLAGISEQFMPGNRAIEHLPDEWRNRPLEEGIAIGRDGHEPDFNKWHMGAMELFGTDQEPRAEAMWQEMPPAAINWHGALLWPRMDEYAWRSLVKLIDVYRAVRKASNDKVWG
jgi:hypothetical protein